MDMKEIVNKYWKDVQKHSEIHVKQILKAESLWADIVEKRKQLLESGKAETIGIINFLNPKE
jgi:hypothetical protein